MNTFILTLTLIQCNQRTEYNSPMQQDSIVRPMNISAQSGVLNLGGIDAPGQYIWAEYGGLLSGGNLKSFYPDGRAKTIEDNRTFDDLHIINFYDKGGNFRRKAVFQVFPFDRRLSIQKSDSISVGTYSGDRVIYIIKGNQKFELAEVLNLDKTIYSKKYLGKKFEQVHSIIKLDKNSIESESVSWGDFYNISITKSNAGNFYDVIIVTMVDTDKIQRYKLHSNETGPVNLSLIRYYDSTLDRIYFVENAYLEAFSN